MLLARRDHVAACTSALVLAYALRRSAAQGALALQRVRASVAQSVLIRVLAARALRQVRSVLALLVRKVRTLLVLKLVRVLAARALRQVRSVLALLVQKYKY
jgi:hypothetical protein